MNCHQCDKSLDELPGSTGNVTHDGKPWCGCPPMKIATNTPLSASGAKGIAMAKKPLPASFSEIVCHQLRQLANWHNKAITEKKAAEELRDELEDEIKGEEDGDNQTRLDALKARYCDAVREIKRWSRIKKAASSKMVTVIQKGDQAELFEVEKITEKTLFEADTTDSDDDGEGVDKELAGAEA